MTENATLSLINMNDSIVNSTMNQSIFQINDITDVQNILSHIQEITSNMLISWNMIPEDIYFRITLTSIAVIVLYQLFVSGSSKIGGAFKFVLMSVLVVIILIALGIL